MKKLLVLALMVSTLGLTACTSEHTSTTSFDVSTTTDEGTKDYSFKAENNNGEVTTESSVTETPADNDNYADADTDDNGEDFEASDELLNEAKWLDDGLIDGWDSDKAGHDISYDEDTLYVHIWSGEISSSEDLIEDDLRNDTIPSWTEAVQDWMRKFKEDGADNLHICLQDVSQKEGEVFFTIEDGELTYCVFDK